MSCVYRITNQSNRKVYVGATTKPLRERLYGHTADTKRGSEMKLHCAIREEGFANFFTEVLETNLAKEDLRAREDWWILKLKANQPEFGYNDLVSGSPSKESRDKNAASQKGRIHSSETKAKIAASRAGKKRPPFSEEWKAKMSSAHLARHKKEGDYIKI